MKFGVGLLVLVACVLPFCIGEWCEAHDGTNDAWFQGLTVPGTNGALCCTTRDCHAVTTRYREGHLEAFISSVDFPDSAADPREGHAPNDWVRVREAAVLHGKDNPVGAPVACWFERKIYCFVEGPQV